MPRDYTGYDMEEPRRIQVLDVHGNVTNVLWASINFCLLVFADESMWAIEPPPVPEEPSAELTP